MHLDINIHVQKTYSKMLTVIESCGGFTGMYCAIFPTFQYVGNYSCKTIKNSKCKLF